MAEKKIPITYRAMGEEDKRKRICLNPNDSVQEIEEKSKELFKLQGRVCLKAKIASDVFIIEANSQDRDVLHDADELIIQPNNFDKLVRREEEVFDLDKLPLYTSKLVWRERLDFAIPPVATEFNRKVVGFLYTAHYGTKKFTEINEKVEQIGLMLEKLCKSSWQSMGSFYSKGREIREKLHDAIKYVFDGQGDIAMLNFKAIDDISKTMRDKSSELQKMFEAVIDKVLDTIDSIKAESSKQEQEEMHATDKELESQKGRKLQLVQTLQVLHWAITGLNKLSDISIKTRQIFEAVSNAVDDLASHIDDLNKKVGHVSAKRDGLLQNLCQLETFKNEALSCLSKCVALEHILSSHKIQMKDSMDGVHKFLCENPTDEADRKMKNIWETYERDLQQTRDQEDDQEEEGLPFLEQQVDSKDNEEFLSCVLPEDALVGVEGGTHPGTMATGKPHGGPEEGSPVTEPVEAAVGVSKGDEPPPHVRPISYSSAVKQQSVDGEEDVRGSQQGDDGEVGNTTESHSSQAMQAAGTIPLTEVSRRNQERFRDYEEANLYVYNLDANTDEDDLRTEFEPFGEVISVKVVRGEEGHSKRYGFVCLSSREEADAAIEGMNGRRVNIGGNKPLVVEHKQQTTNDPRRKEAMHRPQEPFKPYEGANIFVNHLDTSIDEKSLEQIFSQFGSIISSKIWRNKDGASQGFGFVCYNSQEEAVRATKQMDGKTIKNKPVIVDLAQKTEGRNVYVNNLAHSINDRHLYDIFKQSGKITSAKVMTDEYGNSKGYGFVCFETSQEAATAIEQMNGEIIENKQLYVDLHVPRKEGRNIFVSNLADCVNDDRLYQEFAPFGTITSAKVMVDLKDGSSKGFGFVCFSSPQEASLAVDEMKGKIIEKQQLYVDVAQSRAGRNVYVYNLADRIDANKLQEAFAKFGTITSAKVNTDSEGNSAGSGFVCYSSPKEARAAIKEMNGFTLENQVLSVALAQPPQRRANLK